MTTLLDRRGGSMVAVWREGPVPLPVRSWLRKAPGLLLDGSFSSRRSPGSPRWVIGWWLATAAGFLVGLRPARYDRG
jgi:hypothetical protein